MGTVDFQLERNGVVAFITAEYYQSDFLEAQVGKQVSIEVVSGDENVHQNLQELVQGAGVAAVGTDLNGTGAFVDRVRPGAEATSALVGVKPNNIPEMDGIWAICLDGDDQTVIPGSNRLIRLDLQVVARRDEYADFPDVKSALEVSVP